LDLHNNTAQGLGLQDKVRRRGLANLPPGSSVRLRKRKPSKPKEFAKQILGRFVKKGETGNIPHHEKLKARE